MIRITWNIGRVALIVFCGWLLLHASEERARAARMTSMIVAELKSPDEHMISERLRFVTDLLNKGTDPQIFSSAALVLLALVPYARRKTNTEPK
ncbi:MAG: hypothetical protein ACE5NW_15525 [Acidiferrobacterales bacterium]